MNRCRCQQCEAMRAIGQIDRMLDAIHDYSDDERRTAAEHLGMADHLPDPQQPLCLEHAA